MAAPTVRQLLAHTQRRAQAVASFRTAREIKAMSAAWEQGTATSRSKIETNDTKETEQ